MTRDTIRPRLRGAAAALAFALSLAPAAAGAQGPADDFERGKQLLARGDAQGAAEALKRAQILAKPTPGYTEAARQAGVSGVVRVRVVLGADGKVKHVLVLRRLSHGLTEKAIEAARRVRFEPATLGGQPVSQYVVLEYGFNLNERFIRTARPGW